MSMLLLQWAYIPATPIQVLHLYLVSSSHVHRQFFMQTSSPRYLLRQPVPGCPRAQLSIIVERAGKTRFSSPYIEGFPHILFPLVKPKYAFWE